MFSRLTIDWQPPGDTGQTIVLRLQAFVATDGASEPAGEEVTCLVADTGRADLALAPLARAGLGVESGTGLLRVSASRFDVAQVNAGNFGLVNGVLNVHPLRGASEQRRLSSAAELRDVLESTFGIAVPPGSETDGGFERVLSGA